MVGSVLLVYGRFLYHVNVANNLNVLAAICARPATFQLDGVLVSRSKMAVNDMPCDVGRQCDGAQAMGLEAV